MEVILFDAMLLINSSNICLINPFWYANLSHITIPLEARI